MSRLWSTQTSGDMIADNRYAWGDGALSDGDFIAARDLFEQALEKAPLWPPAHYALGRALMGLGDVDAARAALTHCRDLDPEDRLGAGLLLARLAGDARRDAMPDGFVAALFDEYAPRFDAHLVESLAYRAPDLIAQMLTRHGVEASMIYDLGCGTGLMAKAMPPTPGTQWHGVDLSRAMLDKAASTGLYASLEAQELRAWLEARGAKNADLVLAADVFCYVPELAPVFASAARVLREGGWLGFSIQTHEGHGAVIGEDMRVHHAPGLICDLGTGAGFDLIEEQRVSTRRDRGQDVPGALYLMRKRA